MMIVWLDSDHGGNEELRYLVSVKEEAGVACFNLRKDLQVRMHSFGERAPRKTERVTRFLLLAFKFE